MAIKPILFSGPMVRAILEGRKTQTRRVIKPQPASNSDQITAVHLGGATWRLGALAHAGIGDDWTLPYAVGDLLYVRETWRADARFDGRKPSEISSAYPNISYVATEEPDPFGVMGKTRVSIHMPVWASRLTLKVTEVRVQFLQKISGDDAIAEGVVESHELVSIVGGPNGPREIYDYRSRVNGVHDEDEGFEDPAEAFADLWDSLNADRGFGWAVNPWVAAYTFEPHHCNVNDFGKGAA